VFQHPFSFEGRIRRTEYGLSVLIYFGAFFISTISSSFIPGNTGNIINLLSFIALMWFMIAQGSKRCHDLGRNGAFQLIPFYALWLLFEDSHHGINEYGINPKGVGNDVEFSFENK
jgi:uncharacterized membrane protein YhaH (DUF805 family)